MSLANAETDGSVVMIRIAVTALNDEAARLRLDGLGIGLAGRVARSLDDHELLVAALDVVQQLKDQVLRGVIPRGSRLGHRSENRLRHERSMPTSHAPVRMGSRRQAHRGEAAFLPISSHLGGQEGQSGPEVVSATAR